MKPISTRPLLLLLLCLFVVAACKKSSTAKTNTELLAQTTWKFSAATVNGSDVSSFLQTCQKDNILTFQSNGNGDVDEGATKCNSNDPQSNSFTWNFLSNETMLHVSAILFTGGSSDFSLITLTETQLVVSQDIDVNGSTQNAVVTFTH